MSSSMPTTEAKVFNAKTQRLKVLVPLIVVLCAFIASDRYLSFLEDETFIVNAARQPVAQTLALFWSGGGQHEHPPLSDLLLHFWLPVAGSSPWLLRLPSEVFYLAGILLLALTAQFLAGSSAFTSMIYVGAVWPFAFHFARLAGWYSSCFFLASAMTLSYFKYLEKPSWGWLAVFVSAALMMVYSNYYGWALVVCFVLDVCMRKPKEALKFLLFTFGVLILAYTPMWTVFFNELSYGTHISNGPTIVPKLLNSIYCFYSLFVSESVAPWIWLLSFPALVGILVSIVTAVKLLSKQHKIFMAYFALQFGGMAIIGIIGTKRLLFISGWLLLSFSIALANQKMKGVRMLLVISLVVVSAVGWTGVFARRWYAAPHFIEPWAEIADESAIAVGRGQTVVSNSPAFLFYANYALHRQGPLKAPFSPGWVEDPRITAVNNPEFSGVHFFTPYKPSTVLFVNGVNTDAFEETELVEAWLRANCSLVSMRQLVPDSGYPLKTRFFKGSGQPQFRIQLERYECVRP